MARHIIANLPAFRALGEGATFFVVIERKGKAMCDYSLHTVATRPARVGDKLVSSSFTNSFTRGFIAEDEPNVAVCLMPGTELAFEQDVQVDHGFGRLLPTLGFGKIGARVARFRQINMNRPDSHHDALEFPNGRVVLVTRLYEGQVATVLQLPANAQPEDERATPLAEESLRHEAISRLNLPTT